MNRGIEDRHKEHFQNSKNVDFSGSFKGVKLRKDEQLHFAGHSFELMCDLGLSSLHSASKNPGSETPLGAWSWVE